MRVYVSSTSRQQDPNEIYGWKEPNEGLALGINQLKTGSQMTLLHSISLFMGLFFLALFALILLFITKILILQDPHIVLALPLSTQNSKL